MTKEQKVVIKKEVDFYFNILLQQREKKYNNEWSELFNNLVIQTQRDLISKMEKYFLQPVLTGVGKYIFKEEDTQRRQQISREVNNHFKAFKIKNND